MARNRPGSTQRRRRWAAGGIVVTAGTLALAYGLTRRNAPPGLEVGSRSPDRERDPSAWLDLYRRLDAQHAATPQGKHETKPHVGAPSPPKPSSDAAPIDDREEQSLRLAAEAIDPEDERRPLGGLSLELIPPPTAPLADRTEATQTLYNEGDDLAAREAALALLEEDPANLGLIRIVASTACMDGLTELAQAHYARLPGSEQREMRMHCLRHGTVLDVQSEAEDEAALDDFLEERSDDWDPARTGPPPDMEDDLE